MMRAEWSPVTVPAPKPRILPSIIIVSFNILYAYIIEKKFPNMVKIENLNTCGP